ncbi:hypothetical protein [Haloferax massiliensis]|uniref:hypothetical protein n=1 Tax=Haloferax massiliensis TaxID=1476858 RepID=UPI001111C3FD|nr:hypothetical protein [Haloferax massiliensis]
MNETSFARRKFIAATTAGLVGAIAGCTGGESEAEAVNTNSGSTQTTQTSDDSGQLAPTCETSKIEDESLTKARWEGYANGTTEIESVELTVSSVVDFPTQVAAQVFFYREKGGFEPSTITKKEFGVLSPNERKTLTITRTGLNSKDWDVELLFSCP